MPFVSGITGQLSAAGLEDKVKVAGESADVEGLQLLQKGTMPPPAWRCTTAAG